MPLKIAKQREIRATALIVLPDLFSAVNRDLIIALAARYGVPAIYYKRAYAEIRWFDRLW
jgi:hypothetical protein